MKLAEILPPHDLPSTISIPFKASISVLNLTKSKPLIFPELQSIGKNESMIFSALQNMASSSGLEISL